MAFERIKFSAFGAADPINLPELFEIHLSQDIYKVERATGAFQEVIESSRVKASVENKHLNMNSDDDKISRKPDYQRKLNLSDIVSYYELDIETDYVYTDLLPNRKLFKSVSFFLSN